ncbi:MAG: hypothetical protein GY943_22455, partial [Chloroflexi bacterium]|nr:hypothetical protein [Chloroflexota bacterium]
MMSRNNDLRATVRFGLLAGVILLSISAIGMVEAFNERDIVTGLFGMGQLVILSTPLIAAYYLTRPNEDVEALNTTQTIVTGLIIGVMTA